VQSMRRLYPCARAIKDSCGAAHKVKPPRRRPPIAKHCCLLFVSAVSLEVQIAIIEIREPLYGKPGLITGYALRRLGVPDVQVCRAALSRAVQFTLFKIKCAAPSRLRAM
jgi:hypothetical protein